MLNNSLIDNLLIAPCFAPVDASEGSPTELYINAKLAHEWLIVLQFKAAAGTDTSAVTLLQATAAAGTGEKALSFSKMWKDVAVAAATYVLTETTVSSDTFSTAATTDHQIYVIPVKSSSLDVANGFDWFRVNVTDPGSNDESLVSALAIGGSCLRYGGVPTLGVTALA